ncbi:MAG: hypothetical protein K2J80_12620, partial [Oscillospiraceae bacterium]|nr:hypothetical protein [Oscillospiraceae bacterium]
GGITAVMLNKGTVANAGTNDEFLPVDNLLKCGNYYLGGDKNADLWIEVNPDFLILKGTDVDVSIRKAITERALPDEDVEREISEAKILYCTEKVYAVTVFGTEKSPYMILVSRHNTVSDPKELENTNAAFPYNDTTDTINLSLFGDFTLVQ